MVSTIIFWGIVIYFGTAVVVGIVQYFRQPKPPDGMTYKQYKAYYNNKEWLNAVPVESEPDEQTQAEIDLLQGEIDSLYFQLDLLVKLQSMYDDDPMHIYSEKELKKYITTERQIHTTKTKIAKLENKLEKVNTL